MPNHSRLNKIWLVSYTLLFAAAAQAESTRLPEAFWDYFIEYGNHQGELFDPVDLAEAKTVAPANTQAKTQTSSTDSNQRDNEEQQP